MRIKNVKFPGYYFLMNTNTREDFHICISVPLNWLESIRKYNIQFHWQFLITYSDFWLVNILLQKFDTASEKE